MDRRQRKTREAIFRAFTALLAEKDYSRITVEQIIDRADVGRATFYAHFETKDYLLKDLCQELFCHIFDAVNHCDHAHIFQCNAPEPVFLHLFQHLQKNDNGILQLFSCQSSQLFLDYFKVGLRDLAVSQQALFAARKDPALPQDFWTEHIVCVFVDTLRWWIAGGMQQSAETITEYFYMAV